MSRYKVGQTPPGKVPQTGARGSCPGGAFYRTQSRPSTLGLQREHPGTSTCTDDEADRVRVRNLRVTAGTKCAAEDKTLLDYEILSVLPGRHL